MKKHAAIPAVETKKVIVIMSLLITSVIIVLLGASFSVYSLLYNVSLPVMGSKIHGSVFGVVVLFLGVRYFLSVQRLKAEVYKTTSRFSWSNFQKSKRN